MLSYLVVVLAVAQSPSIPPPSSAEGKGGAASATTVVKGTDRDDDAPPPGTPEDQALWREAYEINNQILVERGIAVQAQWKAHNGTYVRRLEELAAKGGPTAAEAAALRRRLQESWTATSEVLSRQWPVDPTRACRYEMLHLESSMLSKVSAYLPEARKNLRTCLDKAKLVLGQLVPSSRRLEETMAEADGLLAATPAAPPLVKTAK